MRRAIRYLLMVAMVATVTLGLAQPTWASAPSSSAGGARLANVPAGQLASYPCDFYEGAPCNGEVTRIVNVNSGKCLEMPDWSTLNGARAQQWTCVNGVWSQWWQWHYSGTLFYGNSVEHLYTITNAHSGKCLEVADSRFDNGAPVQQWDCVTAGNGTPIGTQTWSLYYTLETRGNRRTFITNFNSGKVLEIPDNLRFNGVKAQQWDAAWPTLGTQLWDH